MVTERSASVIIQRRSPSEPDGSSTQAMRSRYIALARPDHADVGLVRTLPFIRRFRLLSLLFETCSMDFDTRNTSCADLLC